MLYIQAKNQSRHWINKLFYRGKEKDRGIISRFLGGCWSSSMLVIYWEGVAGFLSSAFGVSSVCWAPGAVTCFSYLLPFMYNV